MTDSQSNSIPQSKARPRLWVLVLVLIIVFVCGGISGGFIAIHKARGHIQTMLTDPDRAKDQIVRELTSKLSLDEDQALQVKEIVQRRHTAIVAIRTETAPKVLKEFDGMENEMLEILNDDQKKKFLNFTKLVRNVFLPAPAKSDQKVPSENSPYEANL